MDFYNLVGGQYSSAQTSMLYADEETRKIPERKSKSIYSLVFKLNMQAQDSIGLFSSRFSPKQPNKMEEIKMRGIKMEPFTLKNAYLAYSFDKNGNLKKLENGRATNTMAKPTH
jgi:hypothetical protein